MRRRTHVLATLPVAVATLFTATAFGGASPLPVLGSSPACPSAIPGSVRCLVRALTVDGREFHPTVRAFDVMPTGVTPITPADLVSAYGLFRAGDGRGQMVGIIVAYDNPVVTSDLTAYRSAFGLPPMSCDASGPCFRVVDQNGGTTLPRPDTAWAQETSLDVDAVSAACPLCDILLVEANSASVTDMFAGVATAVRLGAVAVSMSWGAMEAVVGSIVRYETTLSARSVAFVAASGDSGFGDAYYPASSPNVIAVGGTTLRPAGNARGWDESVWQGSGSACSAFQIKPVWQKDLLCAGRTIADVSAVGDPATGLIIYHSFGGGGPWWAAGGTSLSAPIIAALLARDGGNHGNPGASAFYSASNINDVTRGSNFSVPPTGATPAQRCMVYLCAAGAHYDAPSGVGTPDGPPRPSL